MTNRDCLNGDCPDRYGDPEAWCPRCKRNAGMPIANATRIEEALDELEAEKAALEHTIYLFLYERMKEFHERTGISVERINLSFTSMTEIGKKRKTYLIREVECDLDRP